MTSRKTSQNPLVLERRLGFWFKQGISRPTKTDKPFIGPPLQQLNAHIKRLNQIWGFESTETIRHSLTLKHDIDRIFHQLASTLWPDQPARRQALWLVDAQGTTHNGLYPKDLFASDPSDRSILLDIFTLLIRAKLIKKRLNNDRDARLHGDVVGEDIVPRKRRQPKRRTGSFSASPSSTSELTEFTESDSDLVDDMAAPPADMYHPPRASGPPFMHPDISRDAHNVNNARNSQSRTSGVHTPQSNIFLSDTTPEATKSRRRESADELSPRKKHKTGAFGTSTPTQSPPPSNGTGPFSQPQLSSSRPEASRETSAAKAHTTGPPPSSSLPTPRQSASYPASRKGSRKQGGDYSSPALAEADQHDQDNDSPPSASLHPVTLAHWIKDVRCFFDMSSLTSFRGMSCTRLLDIPDSRTLFADLDRQIALAPPAQPARTAVAVCIDIYDPSGSSTNDGGLMYSPFIDRGARTQSTFPLFVEDLAEWIKRGEVSSQIWLLMSVHWGPQ